MLSPEPEFLAVATATARNEPQNGRASGLTSNGVWPAHACARRIGIKLRPHSSQLRATSYYLHQRHCPKFRRHVQDGTFCTRGTGTFSTAMRNAQTQRRIKSAVFLVNIILKARTPLIRRRVLLRGLAAGQQILPPKNSGGGRILHSSHATNTQLRSKTRATHGISLRYLPGVRLARRLLTLLGRVRRGSIGRPAATARCAGAGCSRKSWEYDRWLA
jgi:hypothetical protein